MTRRIILAAALALAACSGDDRDARARLVDPAGGYPAYARVASAAAGARLFARCAACHTIAPGAPDRNGPNLAGVMGSAIGRNSPRYGYTASLQAVGGRWTPMRMDAWLTAPRRFAPGTSMGFAGLADPLDRADLIAYLQARR